MDSVKPIRFVAIFVVGLVLVMGSALIYSIATQSSAQIATNAPPVQAAQPAPPSVAPSGPVGQQETQITGPDPWETDLSPEPPAMRRDLAVPEGRHTSASRERTDAFVPVHTQTSASSPRVASSSESTSAETGTTLPRAPVDEVTVQQSRALEMALRPHTITLATGTPLAVRLADSLSTDQSSQGQFFRATLVDRIVRDGFVLAESVAPVMGQVLTLKRARVFGGAPVMRLALMDLRTTDNQLVRIQTSVWEGLGRSHNLIAGTFHSALGAVSGAVTGAVRGSGLFPEVKAQDPVAKGRKIYVPANTVLQFRLAAPVSLTERVR